MCSSSCSARVSQACESSEYRWIPMAPSLPKTPSDTLGKQEYLSIFENFETEGKVRDHISNHTCLKYQEPVIDQKGNLLGSMMKKLDFASSSKDRLQSEKNAKNHGGGPSTHDQKHDESITERGLDNQAYASFTEKYFIQPNREKREKHSRHTEMNNTIESCNKPFASQIVTELADDATVLSQVSGHFGSGTRDSVDLRLSRSANNSSPKTPHQGRSNHGTYLPIIQDTRSSLRSVHEHGHSSTEQMLPSDTDATILSIPHLKKSITSGLLTEKQSIDEILMNSKELTDCGQVHDMKGAQDHSHTQYIEPGIFFSYDVRAQVENDILFLINASRTQSGVPALEWCPYLFQIAKTYSEKMLRLKRCIANTEKICVTMATVPFPEDRNVGLEEYIFEQIERDSDSRCRRHKKRMVCAAISLTASSETIFVVEAFGTPRKKASLLS